MIRNQENNEAKVVTNFNQLGRIMSPEPGGPPSRPKGGPGSRDPPGGRECVMASKTKTPSIGKAVADLWRTVTSDLFNTYHPERHYMRGPGPKWREKHGAGATADLRP